MWEVKGTGRHRLGLSRCKMEMMTPPTSRPVGNQGHHGRTALDACQELGVGISLPPSWNTLASSSCSPLGELTGGQRASPSTSASPLRLSRSGSLDSWAPSTCWMAWHLDSQLWSLGPTATVPLALCGLRPSPLVAAKSLR